MFFLCYLSYIAIDVQGEIKVLLLFPRELPRTALRRFAIVAFFDVCDTSGPIGCDDSTLLVERITLLHVHVLNLACYCLKSWS